MDVEECGPEAMDVKERKPYRSLTRRRDTERRYTSSSADSEEGKVPQKSYSSSETLKAYDQDARLAYGSRIKDMVPQEAEEFCRTGEGGPGAEPGAGVHAGVALGVGAVEQQGKRARGVNTKSALLALVSSQSLPCSSFLVHRFSCALLPGLKSWLGPGSLLGVEFRAMDSPPYLTAHLLDGQEWPLYWAELL